MRGFHVFAQFEHTWLCNIYVAAENEQVVREWLDKAFWNELYRGMTEEGRKSLLVEVDEVELVVDAGHRPAFDFPEYYCKMQSANVDGETRKVFVPDGEVMRAWKIQSEDDTGGEAEVPSQSSKAG